jgi:GrpB-like predicted nucleotidyltransferase (UPF0157 family)
MIYLAPYNSEWPAIFEAEKEVLLKTLGHHIVAFEHIGSTSIPAIHAKPIIDIMIGVECLHDVNDAVISALIAQGYNYIKQYEVNMPYRRYFQKKNKDGVRTHQIHLVEIKNEFWRRQLLFRNYLRDHPDAAQRYEKLKLELAQQFSDTNEYASAKSEFCNEIYAKALR